jgi:outer membrane lipase/esterase
MKLAPRLKLLGLPWRGLAAAAAGVLLVGALAACGGSVSSAETFSAKRLIAFGDEYSLLDDSASTGNARHYGINALDSSDTSNATVSCSTSTQMVWVQYVASYYGLTFAQCNPNGVAAANINALMRASYGARVAEVQQQIAKFEDVLDGSFSDSDVVTLMVGLHDVVEVYESDDFKTLEDKKAELYARGEQLAQSVNHVANLGPRVIVSLLLDVGLTPYAQGQGSGAMSDLTGLSDAFNLGMRENMLNDGHKIGLVLFDTAMRSLHASSSYTHDALACDTDHRNTDTHTATGVVSSGDLLDCSTATMVNDSAATTYLWADKLHANAYIVQRQLGLLARTRASGNPF